MLPNFAKKWVFLLLIQMVNLMKRQHQIVIMEYQVLSQEEKSKKITITPLKVTKNTNNPKNKEETGLIGNY